MYLPLPGEVKTFFAEIKNAVKDLQVWDGESPYVHDKHRKVKPFTPDGRMVGDVGEALAERFFKIRLEENQKAGYDAVLEDDESVHVEVKMTKKGVFQFRKLPDRVIAISLEGEQDKVEVVFNGPGKILIEKVAAIRNKATPEGDHWNLSTSVNVQPADIRGLVAFDHPKRVPLRPGVKPLRVEK
jgi:hypothetical protein